MTGETGAWSPQRLAFPALALSLLLNGFLIGVVVHSYLAPAPSPRSGLIRAEVGRMVAHLPPEYQEKVRAEVRELVPDLRKDWARLRELRGRLHVLIAAGEPDRAEIEARLKEIREITTSIQAQTQQRSVEALLRIPPDVRQTSLAASAQ